MTNVHVTISQQHWNQLAEMERTSILVERFLGGGAWDLSVLLLLGPRGEIQGTSGMLASILGYTDDELVGVSFLDLIAPEDRSITEGAYSDFRTSPREAPATIGFRNKWRTKDGRRVLLEWRAHAYAQPTGMTLASASIVQEATS